MAAYNDSNAAAIKNYVTVILNRLSIIGFFVMDYMERFDEANNALAAAVSEGKLVVEGAETVVDATGKLEDVPRIWNSLFEGTNTGKLITKLSD